MVLGGAGADEYRRPLAPVATVVSGDQADVLVTAFGVTGYPAVCLVDSAGVITASGRHLAQSRAVPA